MTDLPFLTDGAAPANPAAPAPRKCYRHDWHEVDTIQVTDASEVIQLYRTECRRCGKPKAPAATVSRVRRASARGFRTSADLAAYLGGQNVDRLGWPWDVQGQGYRVQSKRDQVTRGHVAYARLIDAIPVGGDYLRGVYHVPPRKRLESGVVVVRAIEWMAWHGTPFPDLPGVRAGAYLLEMPLPTFRDLHIGRTDQ